MPELRTVLRLDVAWLVAATCSGKTGRVPRRRVHRELALDSSHWRRDGQPKVRYATQGEALSAAEELGAESRTRLATYECPYCKGWHFGGRTPDASN